MIVQGLQSFSGKVVAGERIGRTLGFPTANIDVDAAALGL
ncbi:MAG: riboflavin kinase, partial [Bacteroidales bacterium]|nr:riboflavin kinase [Bacteroidales bacterium]